MRLVDRWIAVTLCLGIGLQALLGKAADQPGWWRQAQWRRPVPVAAAGPFGSLFGGRSGSRGSQRRRQVQAAPQPFEEEEEEGAKMMPLDASSSGSLDGSSEAPFGPLALLAVGFTQDEFQRLRRLLHEEMEAEMVKVIPAPASAWDGTLGAALELEPVPQFEQAPLGTRRVLFLSGMYAAEVMETIAAVREAGLPEAVFAAAVPNNYARPLAELVQEVFADHQAMKQQRAAAAAAAAQAQAP
ncbi:hypothetical protein CHLNCDRAFT_138333 [Chlorella variabilis]|uniref:Uncharacterized protein n=1 Tax=Chlorella variabilis TaxID=554065 RepID=E1ZMT4_CHLVA|nr:hypothetical protein CHLNCDRAFT_138333 [Chlorella variabilis]EFN52856.1 hypothetical protein CHLNCDRAFT_138333 [Chlorella variabilis]|eukprot:XP_005844958.1 hypothetical protein CHLNCDRAFT_138333 [Chlorella variabilis]